MVVFVAGLRGRAVVTVSVSSHINWRFRPCRGSGSNSENKIFRRNTELTAHVLGTVATVAATCQSVIGNQIPSHTLRKHTESISQGDRLTNLQLLRLKLTAEAIEFSRARPGSGHEPPSKRTPRALFAMAEVALIYLGTEVESFVCRMAAIENELMRRLRAMMDIAWHPQTLQNYERMRNVVGYDRFMRHFPSIGDWIGDCMRDLYEWDRRIRKFNLLTTGLRAATLPPRYNQLAHLQSWWIAVGEAEEYLWMWELDDWFNQD